MTADDIEHAADTSALWGNLNDARALRFAARLWRTAPLQDGEWLAKSLRSIAERIYWSVILNSRPPREAPARSSLRVGARNSGRQSLEPSGRRDWSVTPRGPVAGKPAPIPIPSGTP